MSYIAGFYDLVSEIALKAHIMLQGRIRTIGMESTASDDFEISRGSSYIAAGNFTLLSPWRDFADLS